MKINKREPAKSGFILIFALMMLALITLITDQLIRSTLIGSAFINTMVDRERAKILALGGINIAIAQLTFGIDAETKVDGEDEKENEFGKGSEGAMKNFIHQLISNLNRWQVFNLNELADGVEGTVGICISSEHGKINLNEAFDFKKQEFKKEYEALLKSFYIPGKIPLGEFYKRLLEFFKKRGKKLCEVSELLTITGFENLDVFYHPPQLPSKGKASAPNLDLYLLDIFTTWTDEALLDPILFSDALCAIFGLTRPQADDSTRIKEAFKKFAMAFKKDLGTDLDGNWKILQPICGEKPPILSALKDIFAKKFSSKVYSVLSYGKVKNVEQRVLAIVKEVEDKPKRDEQKKDADAKDNSAQDKAGDKQGKRYFKIMRLYWL